MKQLYIIISCSACGWNKHIPVKPDESVADAISAVMDCANHQHARRKEQDHDHY